MGIEFKKLPKSLLDEGITIELLDKVQNSGKYSPAMFQRGDEPVKLIGTVKNGFFVMLEDGSYLLDENNKPLLFDGKTCIIARARYWLLFSDVEMAMDEKRRADAKDKEIEKEVTRLTEEVKKEAAEILAKWEDIVGYAKVDGFISDVNFRSTTNFTLLQIMQHTNPEWYEQRVADAKKFLESNSTIEEDFIIPLKQLLEAEDYDSLYIRLKQDGLPLLASASNTDNLAFLKRFLNPSKLAQTIETIQGQSHIKNVAMFNVNKRYS